MRATAEGPVQSTRTAVTAPVERAGKRTAAHASAREHQRSSFGGIVIVSDVAVCSASYFYRHFVLRMQAVESHLFDEAFICRACVAELLIVSGVCVVCVACTLIAAVVLAAYGLSTDEAACAIAKAMAQKPEPLRHLTNNWRKMHGLPMHRKPAAFRRRRKGNGTGKQSK